MRFYSKKYPQVNDIVFVKYNRKTEQYCIIVDLVEYGIEGMIISSEISNRKVNISKIFGNKILPCIVLNIDEEKGYIDLTYKRVLKEDNQKYLQIYPYLEKLIVLGNELCELYCIHNKINRSNEIEELICTNTIWKLFSKYSLNEYEQLYDKLITNPEHIFADSSELSIEFINKCIEFYKKRLNATDLVVANDMNLQILESNGLNKLKEILLNSIPEKYISKIKLECVSSPKYRFILNAKDDNEIKSILNSIDENIKTKLQNVSSIYKFESQYSILKNRSYSLAPFKSYINLF